jgi:hypothetical protein
MKYPRGSLLQRICEPLGFATQDKNGSIVVDIEEKDLEHLKLESEEELREKFRLFTEQREEFERADFDDNAVIGQIIEF